MSKLFGNCVSISAQDSTQKKIIFFSVSNSNHDRKATEQTIAILSGCKSLANNNIKKQSMYIMLILANTGYTKICDIHLLSSLSLSYRPL